MKAPAVSVKTCSQALKRRSAAFGNGSGWQASQIIALKVAMHRTALIHRSNLNIGLMVRVLPAGALAMSLPLFRVPVINPPRVQVDDRGREWMRERGPGNGEHGMQKPPR